MEMVNKICLLIVVFIAVFICGVLVGRKETQNTANTQITLIDTTYNTRVLDSIEYNIVRIDSTIYNIKEEMRYEITKSLELSDSATVNLFKELSTSKW